MATFPLKEVDVISLANDMVSGFMAEPTDFPSVDGTELQAKLAAYNTAAANLLSIETQKVQAVASKNAALTALKTMMKDDLKLAELDTQSNPIKLGEIGWSTRNPANPQVPGTPIDLISGPQIEGSIELRWKRPTSGGTIRNYAIYRTSDNPEGGLANWTFVDFAYSNVVTLAGQPRGVQLYYRVQACNNTGNSGWSNILPVVL